MIDFFQRPCQGIAPPKGVKVRQLEQYPFTHSGTMYDATTASFHLTVTSLRNIDARVCTNSQAGIRNPFFSQKSRYFSQKCHIFLKHFDCSGAVQFVPICSPAFCGPRGPLAGRCLPHVSETVSCTWAYSCTALARDRRIAQPFIESKYFKMICVSQISLKIICVSQIVFVSFVDLWIVLFFSPARPEESLPAGAVTHWPWRDFRLWQNGSQARSELVTMVDQASESNRRKCNDGRMLKFMLQKASDVLLLFCIHCWLVCCVVFFWLVWYFFRW